MDKNSWRGCLQICLALFLLSGSSHAQSSDRNVVAVVNGVTIDEGRFNTSYVHHLIETGRNDTPQERSLHLEELIDMYLLAEEAAAQGLEDAAYQAFLNRQFKKIVGGRYFSTAFLDSLPDLTEAEVRQAFRNTKDRVVLRHILFRTEEEARSARSRIEAGEDFVALANEYFHTAVFDSSAGFLGVAPYWDLDDKIAEVAYALPQDSISTPVRSRYGWHLLRVEDRFIDPLLTESEYVYRSEGIRNQARQRRMRIEGDRFIRSFMEGLNVTVDERGMLALGEAVRQATAGGDGVDFTARVSLKQEEIRSIRDELTPETVLATYILDGERQRFTAGMYIDWLPELPSGEVRSRIAASVGRALRNEVLALKGLQEGLDRDSSVVDEVRYQAARFLANFYRTRLQQDGSVQPTESELKEAFVRLGFNKLKRAHADYRVIPFRSFAEAEAARMILLQHPDTAATYEGYRDVTSGDISGSEELHLALRRALLRQLLVTGTGDGKWYLIEVTDRSLVYTTFEEVRPELEILLRRFLPEHRLLRELRSNASIEVNREAFDRMMKLRDNLK